MQSDILQAFGIQSVRRLNRRTSNLQAILHPRSVRQLMFSHGAEEMTSYLPVESVFGLSEATQPAAGQAWLSSNLLTDVLICQTVHIPRSRCDEGRVSILPVSSSHQTVRCLRSRSDARPSSILPTSYQNSDCPSDLFTGVIDELVHPSNWAVLRTVRPHSARGLVC